MSRKNMKKANTKSVLIGLIDDLYIASIISRSQWKDYHKEIGVEIEDVDGYDGSICA